MENTDFLMEMVNLPDPTNKEKMKMLFFPDLMELILFLFAIIIAYLLDDLFKENFNSPTSLIFIGIACTTFYGYRWGVSSLNDYLLKQEKILKGITPDKPFAVNIKAPGIIIGLLILVIGLIKFKA